MTLDGPLAMLGDDVVRNDAPCPSRRGFLKVAAAVGGLAMAPGILKAAVAQERILSAYAPNTGEMIRLVYWIPGEGYIRESIDEISRFMRDHHNNSIKPIDPKLIDVLHNLTNQLQPREPLHIISGYRSPVTNARLRRRSRGVAKDSYHIRGQAADIRMPGEGTHEMYKAAWSLQSGGVGYYPRSRFIHVDSGPVRTWR